MKNSDLFIGLIFCALADFSCADQVKVAVASNFEPAMRALVSRFEQQTGQDVILSSGSSGKLYAQIVNGAPFQVFFSADKEKPDALVDSGLAVPESQFTYAVGKLVLWTPREDVDVEAILRSGVYRKLALANPRLAPYGEAANEFLQSQGLENSSRPKWVLGENIAQTWHFVSTGNADLGFVAMSQVISSAESTPGSLWIVPQEFYNPIQQDAVVLVQASGEQGVLAFIDFIKSRQGQEIIDSFGYSAGEEQ